MYKKITIPKAYDLLGKTYDDFIRDMRLNDNFFYFEGLDRIKTLDEDRKPINIYTLTVPKLKELEKALEYKYKVILNKDFLKNITHKNIAINNSNVLFVDEFKVSMLWKKTGFRFILRNTEKRIYKGYFPVALISATPLRFSLDKTKVYYGVSTRLTTASANMFFVYDYPIRLLKDVGVKGVEELFEGRKIVYGYELVKANFNIHIINDAIIRFSHTFSPIALANFVDLGADEWFTLCDLEDEGMLKDDIVMNSQRLLAMCRFASETFIR